ncbi:hypothetical protein IHE45_18G026400 [Dioscorea alata]|uniref:Uncharacterized protein n=1 Tax=Dioscorea alata TaxID=55571 RepID=A0ACB7U5P3_DIOAL|nr:hypothetical protein IHE45_18G026400 [Dioscorea alata]
MLATIPPSSKVDVPRPKAYNGARNAKDINIFLWGLEQYFKAFSMDDVKKVYHATLYLTDAMMIWWRRQCSDIERGTLSIYSFEDFKRELNRQFYPKNAKNEASAKL